MERNRILVVDNEPQLLDLVELHLIQSGLRAERADSGHAALKHLDETSFDLVILDIMMDEMDGFTVLERLRGSGREMPVILLSARNEENHKIYGLGLGADDYVTKPFSPAELIARVQAHLRRANKSVPVERMMKYSYGNLRLDPDGQILYRNNQAIPLTSTETKIMLALLKRPNQTLPKALLFEEAWGHKDYDENSINVFMNMLRKKIEEDPREPRYIQTVWGVGYFLAGDPG